jgi:hypothetical protein
MNCHERDSLQRDATAALQKIIDLTKQQITAIHDDDQTRLLALDKNLETAFGEKERSFGALHQHTKEHGC